MPTKQQQQQRGEQYYEGTVCHAKESEFFKWDSRKDPFRACGMTSVKEKRMQTLV